MAEVKDGSYTTSLSNWNFHDYHVQDELRGGEFISAETTLVAAGPPELQSTTVSQDSAGSDFAYPLGVLENVGLSQSKQLQRIFEIGSSRSYFIPGRVVGSVSIGRVIYYGPSLLKCLYSYLPYADNASWAQGAVSTSNLIDGAEALGSENQIQVAPGYGDLLLNLGSDMFNLPFGLAIFFRNQINTGTSGIYLENAHVQGHQLSISSGSVLVMEGSSLQYDRLVPIQITR